MNIKIGKGGSGKINSTKGGSGKTNQKKYIDLLPLAKSENISKITLSSGTYGNGVYTRSDILSINFSGLIDAPDANGNYSRQSGGTTKFTSNTPGSPAEIWWDNSNQYWVLSRFGEIDGEPAFISYDLINWISSANFFDGNAQIINILFQGPNNQKIVQNIFYNVFSSYDPNNWGVSTVYYSTDGINWAPEGTIEDDLGTPPTGVLEKEGLTFLFDPIFYKNEIQNERYKILLQGCSLSYVNGIYSQTVNPSLINNKRYFLKDDDDRMEIYYEEGNWFISDVSDRDYSFPLFYKSTPSVISWESPHELDWSTPDGGNAVGNETPPTITEYLNLTEFRADLDPVYLEELRDYKIDNIIPAFPLINVRQHIPGAPFNSRKAELRNNVYRYIKYNNNDDVEHLKKHGKIIYTAVNSGASANKGKNLQDLIQPLLKLNKNDGSDIITGGSDYTLNMFVKLQRPVSHTAPSNYVVREKRGIFFQTNFSDPQRPIIIGYRSPYYNIDGDTTYKLKFEPFSFVFSFGQAWTSDFGFANFTIMTDYKYKFNQMYMLSISRNSGEYKIYINGELQTVAMLPFNPCVLPSASNSRIRRQHNARMQMTPLAPGFLKKDGSTYSYTSTSWTPENAGANYNFLCFGKSRRSQTADPAQNHHKRKRYLNNLDIGVINSYNIALSQSQISEMYNNFRYRYI